MNDQTFDVLTRRTSLAGLGAAGLAALALPVTADAKNKTKKKAKKKCQGQVTPCTTFLVDLNCDPEEPGFEECQALITTCCQFLATCNFSGFSTCLSSAV